MSSSLLGPTRRVLAVIVTALMCQACGHEQVRRLSSQQAAVTTPRTIGQQAAVVAVRQVGVPYRYGGTTTSGFDCSGLVQYAYSKAGRRIPRTTTQQWRTLTPVERDELRIGDVLFFRIEGKVSHVGLYLGERRFVHAPSSGREVTIAALDSEYYRRALVRGGRP